MPVQKYVPSYLTKFNPVWFVWPVPTALISPFLLIMEEHLLKIRGYREESVQIRSARTLFSLNTQNIYPLYGSM
jgi:hypothetical protein